MTTCCTSTLPDAPPRDAIIFVPGAGKEWSDQSLEVIARKIATALDLSAEERQLQFAPEIQYVDVDGEKVKICTILKLQGGATPVPIADIYELDWRGLLTREFERRSLFVRGWLVLVAIIKNIPRTAYALFVARKSSKNWMEKAEALYVVWIFFLFAAYMVMLLFAAYGMLADMAQAAYQSAVLEQAPTASKLPSALIDIAHPISQVHALIAQLNAVFQPLLITLTLLGVFSPDASREFLITAATDYLCLQYYMDYGHRRNVITGQLERFLEKMAERPDSTYAHYHIIAYSFGSIVAMDTLFPFGAAPSKRMQLIDSLVTIGSPFDLIRAFWPRYFEARNGSPGVPRRWLNVYAPLDLLGSNFRNDSREAEAEEGIRLRSHDNRAAPAPRPTHNISYNEGPYARSLSLLDFLTLTSLKLHGMYWGASNEQERNAFTYFIPILYANDRRLARTPENVTIDGHR